MPDVGAATQIAVGAHPLSAAAAPLLQLLARLRTAANPPDAANLRDRAEAQLRAFQEQAGRTGVPPDQRRTAAQALCASLDDAVLNTPWGSAGAWRSRPLMAGLFPDAQPDGRFFEELKRMLGEPARHLPVIELMYLCMSLGYVGRYRDSPRGPGAIETVREATYQVLAGQLPPPQAALSPQVAGIDAPYRPVRPRVPGWAIAGAGLGLVGLVYGWALLGLNGQSDTLYDAMLAAPPSAMPAIQRAGPVQPPPAPLAEPSITDRLAGRLAADLAAGRVTLAGTRSAPILQLAAPSLFTRAATLAPSAAPLLARIGRALRTEPGSVLVVGYTDSQPTRSAAFPSGFQLSAAQARSVAAAVATGIGDASRLGSEGRGAAEPVASNATAAGRVLNRRIEIVLHRQDG